MAEYISGEQHRAMRATQSSNGGFPKPLMVAIAVIVLMGVSFYGGTAYQKSHQTKTVASTAAGLSGSGFNGRARFGGQRPTAGQVTAVTANSVTVQSSSSGTSTTLSITSSTQITDNGQTVTASDIQVGDTVLTVASTSDKTQAARILVNPSFGSFGGQSGSAGNSTSGNSNAAVTN